jgi:hypothetical protein
VTAQSGDYAVGQVTGAASLASPTFTGTVSGITAAMVGLGNVTNNAQTQAAVMPNTAPGAGQIAVGNAGGTAYAPQTVSGDCTLASTGAMTCTKTNGTAFGTGATATIANYAPLASPGLTGTPTAPTASVGDNSTKIATTAYVRAETYGTWSCAVGGTTSSVQYCNWTVPAGITVTGFDLAASTAAAGCTTYPVLQVWDGTASAEVGSYSITFTTGTSFYTQVTGSTNVASGHQLRFKVTTAAAGCTTNAANVAATVTYQMQN